MRTRVDDDDETNRRPMQSAFNYARLKVALAERAFDLHGNAIVHIECIAGAFGVHADFLQHARTLAIDKRRTPLLEISSAGVATDPRMLARVVVPATFIGSAFEYVASLGATGTVYVTRPASSLALVGKTSNRAKPYSRARALCRDFVLEHRSPTGRTQDVNGRYHGAEFYTDAKPQQLRLREESSRATKNKDPSNVLTSVVIEYLKEEARPTVATDPPTFKISCRKSVEVWFRQDFGHRSANGHTTLHPPKTDACPTCCELDDDIASLEMALNKHRMQHDGGTPERVPKMQRCQLQLDDLKAAKKAHVDAASRAKDAYHAASRAARPAPGPTRRARRSSRRPPPGGLAAARGLRSFQTRAEQSCRTTLSYLPQRHHAATTPPFDAPIERRARARAPRSNALLISKISGA